MEEVIAIFSEEVSIIAFADDRTNGSVVNT